MNHVGSALIMYKHAIHIKHEIDVFTNPKIADRNLYSYIDKGGFENIDLYDENIVDYDNLALLLSLYHAIPEFIYESITKNIKININLLKNILFSKYNIDTKKINLENDDASALNLYISLGILFYNNENNILHYSFSLPLIFQQHSLNTRMSIFILNMFIRYALHNKDPNTWIFRILKILQKKDIKLYLTNTEIEIDIEQYNKVLQKIIDVFNKYIEIRFKNKKHFYDITLIIPSNRILLYERIFEKNTCLLGNGCIDALLIAYDCFLDACVHTNRSLEKLYIYSMLHTGNTLNTGIIAYTFWGAYMGIENIPKKIIDTYLDEDILNTSSYIIKMSQQNA